MFIGKPIPHRMDAGLLLLHHPEYIGVAVITSKCNHWVINRQYNYYLDTEYVITVLCSDRVFAKHIFLSYQVI